MDDESFELLWQHVLDHWDEEAAHRAFLAHAQITGRLPEAAARYRAESAEHDREPLAKRQLVAVTRLALIQLEVSRSRPPPPRRRMAFWVPLVLLVAGIAALFAYLRLVPLGLGP